MSKLDKLSNGRLKELNAEIKAIRARVKRGAKLLDKHGPEDWEASIKPKLLDLSNPRSCVLGQAFKNAIGPRGYVICGFDAGMAKLNLRQAEVIAYGFEANDHKEAFFGEQEYDYLTAAWLDELAERKRKRLE